MVLFTRLFLLMALSFSAFHPSYARGQAVVVPCYAAYSTAMHSSMPNALPPLAPALILTATRTLSDVRIIWQTDAELDLFGFALYRTESGVRISATLVTTSIIPALGSGGIYTFTDATASAAMRHFYWLQAVERSGSISEYGPVIVKPCGSELFFALIRK